MNVNSDDGTDVEYKAARAAAPYSVVHSDEYADTQGDSNTAFDTRQDLAERLLQGRRAIGRDLDGLLRAHAATEGITLPDPRTVSNPFDSTLIRIGARLLTGGMADISPEELTDAWRSVWTRLPEQLDRCRRTPLRRRAGGTEPTHLKAVVHVAIMNR